MRNALRISLRYLAAPCVGMLVFGPSVASANDLTWRTCANEYRLFTSHGTDAHLQCADLVVPVDHDHAKGPTTTVKVMRIHRGGDDSPRPTLLIELGGPGADNRLDFLDVAGHWLSASANDPDLGDFRRVADTHDLVMALPRGLDPDRPMACQPLSMTAWSDFAHALDDDTWNALVIEVSRFSLACGRQAMNAEVNTRTHAEDIDMLRRAMGVQKLHLFGQSYGTWVAMWYASMHPTNTGRMLLDGTMDIGRPFSAGIIDDINEKDRLLIASAFQPMADAPSIYGMGNSVQAIASRFLRIARPLRMAMASQVTGPASVKAAIMLSDWIGSYTTEEVRKLVETAPLSPSDVTDIQTRNSMRSYLGLLGPVSSPSAASGGNIQDAGFSVNYAVHCNDTPWDRTLVNWKRYALQSMTWMPSTRPVDVLVPLMCALWPRHEVQPPDLAMLQKVPAFLMVNAEFDRFTLWSSTQHLLDRFPHAHAIKHRGSFRHGLVAAGLPTCVERHAGRYLFTGQLPALRSSECHVELDNQPSVIPVRDRDELR